MHIGFLALDYPTKSSGGGVGTLVQTIARELVKQNHQVSVIALAVRDEPFIDNDEGVEIHRFQQGNSHWYLSKIPVLGNLLALSVRELERAWGGWQIIRYLQRQRPFDVIELTEEAGLFVTLLMRVPVVARLHGEHYTFYKYTPDVPLTFEVQLSRVLQRIALRQAQLLIAPSHAHAQEIGGELDIDHSDIEIIPNTVQLPQVDYPRPQSSNSGPDDDGPIILYVGRIERLKGVPLLLEAAPQVLAIVPKARFVLAGGNHPTLFPAELEALLDRYNLNGRIQFLGHVPREQLFAWYQQATICVLPSYYETFGIAALEPMAFGVPIIATKAGGIPEVVEDRVTGLLVPPGEASALAQAIVKLLQNDQLCQRMSEAGQERVKQFFTVDKAVQRTIEVYQSAITC